ncbi:MAG: hypothetical protein ACRDZU_04295, partial [Acidimicrobiales bacterium]
MATTTPSAPPSSSNPPLTHFSVWQRLFRGYGPLAVLALMVILMSFLVPTKTPEGVDAGAGFTADSGSGNSDGDTAEGVETDGTPGSEAEPGTPGAPGSEAEAPVNPGTACPDRDIQIPGDPYSPPCLTFSGNNGGATATGVDDTKIRVSFRVLDERGFQQTLAELAGASLTDTPETVRNTVSAFADYFNQRFQLYG